MAQYFFIALHIVLIYGLISGLAAIDRKKEAEAIEMKVVEDVPHEVERHYQPIIASGDFEPRSLSVQNPCIRSGQAHIVH